jgi:hypothetical protein
VGRWRRIDHRYAIHNLAYAESLSQEADRVFVVSEATAYLLYNIADIDMRDVGRFYTDVASGEYLPVDEFDPGYAAADGILSRARLELMEMPLNTQILGDPVSVVRSESTEAGESKMVGSLVSFPPEMRLLTAVSGFHNPANQSHLQLRILPAEAPSYIHLAFEKLNAYNGRIFWSGAIYYWSNDQIQVFVSNPGIDGTLELALIYCPVETYG